MTEIRDPEHPLKSNQVLFGNEACLLSQFNRNAFISLGEVLPKDECKTNPIASTGYTKVRILKLCLV